MHILDLRCVVMDDDSSPRLTFDTKKGQLLQHCSFTVRQEREKMISEFRLNRAEKHQFDVEVVLYLEILERVSCRSVRGEKGIRCRSTECIDIAGLDDKRDSFRTPHASCD